jgi:BCD family chlorophyll transporter-like MFS transporter
MILNCVALWKQEARDPSRTATDIERPAFRDAWQSFARRGRTRRFLVAVGLGTTGFAMQDVLLEPYGGEILGLTVGATTTLTAILASGTIAAVALAARILARGGDVHRLAGFGALIGIAALSAVTFAAPLESPALFRGGAALLGFGAGLFSVGTLTAAMGLDEGRATGLALGAWGAVQASAAGIGIAMGGAIRDAVSALAAEGVLGPALTGASVGYGVVYQIEIVLLFAALIAIGPLVRPASTVHAEPASSFGLAEFPG